MESKRNPKRRTRGCRPRRGRSRGPSRRPSAWASAPTAARRTSRAQAGWRPSAWGRVRKPSLRVTLFSVKDSVTNRTGRKRHGLSPTVVVSLSMGVCRRRTCLGSRRCVRLCGCCEWFRGFPDCCSLCRLLAPSRFFFRSLLLFFSLSVGVPVFCRNRTPPHRTRPHSTGTTSTPRDGSSRRHHRGPSAARLFLPAPLPLLSRAARSFLFSKPPPHLTHVLSVCVRCSRHCRTPRWRLHGGCARTRAWRATAAAATTRCTSATRSTTGATSW